MTLEGKHKMSGTVHDSADSEVGVLSLGEEEGMWRG